jgi:hypothetical protein
MFRSSIRPTEEPSRLDKLTQLQGLDNLGQQADSSRNTDLMHMLTTLYGIQHENAMQPEQLRALRASSAAKEYETGAAPQMTAADLALKGAQTSNLQANADATRKYDVPSLHELMLAHQGGTMPDPDYYKALHKVPGMEDVAVAGEKRMADAEASRAQERGIEEGRTGPLPANHIPDYARQDPEVQSMLRDQQKDKDFYKQGGGLDLGIQQDKLRRQVHPFIQGLKDLWTLGG